jgi:hypothetical protein
VEGKKLGIDEGLVRLLGEHSPIPVTYAGGARSLPDLELVRGAGRGKVDITVGTGGLCRAGTYPKLHAPMLAKVELYPKYRQSTQKCMIRCWRMYPKCRQSTQMSYSMSA